MFPIGNSRGEKLDGIHLVFNSRHTSRLSAIYLNCVEERECECKYESELLGLTLRVEFISLTVQCPSSAPTSFPFSHLYKLYPNSVMSSCFISQASKSIAHQMPFFSDHKVLALSNLSLRASSLKSPVIPLSRL